MASKGARRRGADPATRVAGPRRIVKVGRALGYLRTPVSEEKPKRPPLGVVNDAVDELAVLARLGAMGEHGSAARALDLAVEGRMAEITALSSLSSPLALDYLERLKHPLSTLGLEAGVFVTTRGYVAHLAVEADPRAYGAADVPVLGTLPPLRRGQPPRDLLTRVVKATRRGFAGIRAVNEEIWDGFVLTTVWRVHDHEPAGEVADDKPAGHLDPLVVDGLVRFGWVLRQVDIHYGLDVERG